MDAAAELGRNPVSTVSIRVLGTDGSLGTDRSLGTEMRKKSKNKTTATNFYEFKQKRGKHTSGHGRLEGKMIHFQQATTSPFVRGT